MQTREKEQEWQRANQRHLSEALAVVRRALERHLARVRRAREEHLMECFRPWLDRGAPDAAMTSDAAPGATVTAPGAPPARGRPSPEPPALERLCAALGLSAFERDLLLLCAGVELDSDFAACLAAAQAGARRAAPTFSLALAVLPKAHWSALSPSGPLRYYGLIHTGAGDSLTQSPLQIDERVLHYLTGIPCLEAVGRLEPILPDLGGTTDAAALGQELAALWSQPAPPLIQLRGAALSSPGLLSAACRCQAVELLLLRTANLPDHPEDRERLVRLWERESLLHRRALLLYHQALGAAQDPAHLRDVGSFLDRAPGRVLVLGLDVANITGRGAVILQREDPASADAGSG